MSSTIPSATGPLATGGYSTTERTDPSDQISGRSLIARANAVIEEALGRAERPVMSTNFRPGAAALLDLVTQHKPNIPVVWIDTGLNTPATYRYIESLRERLGLNLQVFTPALTTARHNAVHGELPAVDTEAFAPFVDTIKLEPFRRAFRELRPDIWFTGIRAEQSSFRQSLGVYSRGYSNSERVAPLFEWTRDDLAAYLRARGIDDNDNYIDPTKPAEHLECGLQQLR